MWMVLRLRREVDSHQQNCKAKKPKVLQDSKTLARSFLEKLSRLNLHTSHPVRRATRITQHIRLAVQAVVRRRRLARAFVLLHLARRRLGHSFVPRHFAAWSASSQLMNASHAMALFRFRLRLTMLDFLRRMLRRRKKLHLC